MSNVAAWQACHLEAFTEVPYHTLILHLSYISAALAAVATCSFLNVLKSLNSHVVVMRNVSLDQSGCNIIPYIPR